MQNKQRFRYISRGFTIIEMIVVIAIISILASIVMANINNFRIKARDTKRQADFKSITTALYAFYAQNGRMPNNYSSGGACEGDGFYEQSMQELINAGIIGVIPKSPSGSVYCYFNYGGGNSIGALMVTWLEAAPVTTTGIPPSCRPWPPTVNWCNQSSSNYYCRCNPY